MNHRDDETQQVERSLTDFFADVRHSERAPSGLWGRVESRIGDEAEQASGAGAPRGQRIPRWIGAIGFATSLALVAVVLLNLPGRGSVVSAEEILERAQTAARTPAAAGIQSVVAEQRFVRYFLGTDVLGVPALEGTARAWYQAPDRQRLEYSFVELDADGRTLSENNFASVWDGSEYWTYDTQEGVVTVLRQDPEVDTFEQLTLSGFLPSQDAFLDEPSCREASVAGEEEVVGRSTDVVELSPSTCGFTLPGSDGRLVLAVDQETGLVLR